MFGAFVFLRVKTFVRLPVLDVDETVRYPIQSALGRALASVHEYEAEEVATQLKRSGRLGEAHHHLGPGLAYREEFDLQVEFGTRESFTHFEWLVREGKRRRGAGWAGNRLSDGECSVIRVLFSASEAWGSSVREAGGRRPHAEAHGELRSPANRAQVATVLHAIKWLRERILRGRFSFADRTYGYKRKYTDEGHAVRRQCHREKERRALGYGKCKKAIISQHSAGKEACGAVERGFEYFRMPSWHPFLGDDGLALPLTERPDPEFGPKPKRPPVSHSLALESVPARRSHPMPAENPYFDVVDRLKIKEQRYALSTSLSARPGARPSEQRGEKVSEQKLEALIWGLSHDNPVVRWQCLELLDTHPDQRAVPAIEGLLNDPVPRVRWHALHALECDVCKGGESLLEDPILAKIRELAEQDENKRVRAYAQRIVDSQGPGA